MLEMSANYNMKEKKKKKKKKVKIDETFKRFKDII